MMLQVNHKSGVLASTLSKTFAVILALSLVLGGLGGLVAAAEDAAPVVSNVYSATLPAGTGTGSFALYELAYSADATLVATVRPVYADAGQGSSFGVSLYGAPGLVAKGVTKNDGASIEVRYIGDAADTLTLQVYNYSNQPVSFDLEVVGADVVTAPATESAPATAPEDAAAPATPAAVEPAATPEVVATEAAAPAEEAAAPAEEAAAPATPAATEPAATPEAVATETAEPVAADTTVATPMVLDISATLVGETAGAYARYDVVIPEDAAPLTVTFRPLLDKSFGATVGFGVYGAAGLVASGQSDGAGAFTASLKGVAGETLTIQVYNYAPGNPVDYSLQVSR